jgi:aromatic ring-opening dioxygenase catalytic subunit (LigB family)
MICSPQLYDYGGFPRHTYEVKYSAPGQPAVASRVQKLLQSAGFNPRIDPKRGFDHGAFVPLYAIYPDASVPVVQLSIREDYNPEAHIKLGRALAPLRDEGVRQTFGWIP